MILVKLIQFGCEVSSTNTNCWLQSFNLLWILWGICHLGPWSRHASPTLYIPCPCCHLCGGTVSILMTDMICVYHVGWCRERWNIVFGCYIMLVHCFLTAMVFMVFWYEVCSKSFLTFFVQAFKIVIDSWKLSMLLLYILWADWPIFKISGSNEQLHQQLEYTLLKPDSHSWWISKIQSGCEDTLEEWYAIKFCFKLGKNAIETYGMLQTAFRLSCMNWASVFEWHKRIKESRESNEGWWEVWEE